MKIGLVSILGNVSQGLNTQGGGYGLICTKIVKDLNSEHTIDINPEPNTWGAYDKLLVCEGVNYTEGSVNVIGGPQPIHKEKMQAIADYTGQIEFINKSFDFKKFNNRIGVENEIWPSGQVIDCFLTGHKKLVAGDSHSLSVWRPGYDLSFNQGKTLFGWMKLNTPDELNAKYPEHVILYFGNIDLRFHLARQDDPHEATRQLFTKYVEFAKTLNNATLAHLFPVEHESRKIPGSGLYKKQPYFGTRQLRMELRQIANDIISNSGLDYITWPEEWVDEDGMKMLEIMESKQSVHIKPKYYPNLAQLLS